MSIHHECGVGIEKSHLSINDWHHEARRVMTNGDREGQIFLSHPNTDKEIFFLLATKYTTFYIGKNIMKKDPRKS